MTTKKLVKWGLTLLKNHNKEENIAFLILRYMGLSVNAYLLDEIVSKDLIIIYKKAINNYIENSLPISLFFKYLFFYNYKFLIDKGCYLPRFETEQLVDELIYYLDSNKIHPNNIIDICCGVGPIAICVKKKYKKSTILGIDINKKAIALAKKNAINLKTNVHFKTQDFFTFKTNILFDLIVMNPPYLDKKKDYVEKSVLEHDPIESLFSKDNGYYFYKILAKKIPKIVNKHFIVCLEIGSNQYKSIINLMKKNFKIVETHLIKDYQQFNRIIIIKGQLL